MKKLLWVAVAACLCMQPAFAQTFDLTQGLTKVGEEIRYSLESPAVMTKGAVEKAKLVWSEEIHYADSSYISVHFSDFDLPRGARLVLRHPDKNVRSWTYRGYGKTPFKMDGGFWGVHIPGETAVLELYSRVPVRAGAVQVDTFAWGYPTLDELSATLLDGEFGNKAICGQDDSEWAQCYSGDIYNKSRAVARLLINGSSACTGWLVGDAGHLMTNNHCIGSSNSALNTDYEFMAEGSCSQNCASFGACPGVVEATSATFVATDGGLDYTLVQLPTNVSSTYGFFQMRTTGAVVDEQIYIPGHPAAWGKRIAVTSGHSSDQSGNCEVFTLNAASCTGGGDPEVGYYCDTQGGSSGSPVVSAADHSVVALHHCANCPNRGNNTNFIIADLGNNLPPNSTVGGNPPPPPPPPPACAPKGASCASDSDCCSNKCKGKAGSKSCK